ncbi:hypothetical protein F4808DRAFT_299110 [Astrocystis sublimbata]|nr:hypothetical protein F4808DRAFT_299110 [Astrocystis sublimbata]
MDYYDIAMRTPQLACAVNPWKGRLALNFKAADYKTTWVSIPDIARVRRELEIPACRNFPDGSDYYTLPILVDSKTGSKLGDSFDIALYLQSNYPDSGDGDLFPAQELKFDYELDLPSWAPQLSERADVEYADYSKFNTAIDAAFTSHVGLVGHSLPLDSEASKAAMAKRSGMSSWDDFKMEGEAREKTLESFKTMLGALAKLFAKDPSGPFLLGKQASYADFIVGGWVYMFGVLLPDEEWQEAKQWHGGILTTLYDAMGKYTEIK